MSDNRVNALSMPTTATRPAARTTPAALWITALAALFLFRLLFGLSSEFFFEDETQIFLMGLKYYATGHWPYFGPDVVWTHSEIPGALQPLLVGLPMRLAPVPEASYVLLNALSFAGLAAFAWYVTKRIPSIPKWLVWGWLMSCPWTLQFSTYLLNPSYTLVASLLFFIGFFEAIPAFRRGIVPAWACFVLMGGAITWVMQLHMSWPLLLPYAGLAWLMAARDGARAAAVHTAAFAAGLATSGAFLLPTLLQYGLHAGSGGTLKNITPHFVNPWAIVVIAARFLSFPSLEIARFIATDTAKRLMFFQRHPWIVPVAAAAWIIGIWQPIWLAREWLRPRSPFPEWRPLKWLVAGTIALVYASFWFVMEPPQAHDYYQVAPIAFLFAAYCWTFVDSPRWRQVAAAVLAIDIAYHAGLAYAQAPERSLYKNRDVVALAVRTKMPEMIGHRRPFAIDAGPFTLADPSRPHDTLRDVQLVDTTWATGPRNMALWKLTVRIANPRVAFRDILYQTIYKDEEGRVVDRRHEYIKNIFQPGDTRGVEVNDGFIDKPFSSAAISVLSAEPLLPMSAVAEER